METEAPWCRVGLPYLVLISTARRYVWHSPVPLGASPGAGEKGEKPRNRLMGRQMLSGAALILWGREGGKPGMVRVLLLNEALPPRWSHWPRCHSRPLVMKWKEKGIESAGLRCGNASHLTAELLGVSRGPRCGVAESPADDLPQSLPVPETL